MDPQHFRILESAYECLESAGQRIEDLRGSDTGCFIGNFSLDQVIKSNRHSYDDRHLHEVIGVDPGLLSSRISYCFDWKGPVFTQNTGCTSSLFALHTAAMALRQGECSSAIVGGVNLLQGPEAYSSYSKFGIMSADSMCHSFDVRCNGYCRGEGVGSIFVKLLSDAVRDGDPIRGVVRSIAVNCNGFVPGMPLFVPNQAGLEMSLRKAYEQANLDPKDTAYVETHGIGMVLGEIAEAHALGSGMNRPERRPKPLMVGSLKPNFGHQEAASGVFVLIKAALMTEAAVIPAHADFETPHPAINLDALNIKPQTETIPWPEDLPTRRVAFQSYGWSGTNAHGIVESVRTLHPEYQLGARREDARYDHSSSRPFLVPFSAFKEKSLKSTIARYEQVADDYYAADIAFTLGCKRSKFSHRAFAIFEDGMSAKSALAESVISTGAVRSTSLPDVAIRFEDRANLSRLMDEVLAIFPSLANNTESARESQHDAAADTVIRIFSEWNIIVRRESEFDLEVAGSLTHIVIDCDNDSFLGLLRLAGSLFLQGYPVNFAEINAVQDVAWKPKVLVDLPGYQWDHSKRYTHETHANRDHRTNPHPYHDLLGRRVFGLAPRTMLWKNKLSFCDLPKSIPWIPNEKPDVSHDQVAFVTMITEAASQAFPNHTPAQISIQEIEVLQPLQYGSDANEIEIQTSLTTDAASTVNAAAYQVAIDSIKEGTWTTHCRAKVCLRKNRTDSPVDGNADASTNTGGLAPSSVELEDASRSPPQNSRVDMQNLVRSD
jgi:acyl transferase domain-containing protein